MSITWASRRAAHVQYGDRAVSSTFEWIPLANCAGQHRHRGSHDVRPWRDVDVPTCLLASQTSWNEAVANQTPWGCFTSRQSHRCFGDLQRGSLPHLLLRMDRHVVIGSIDSLTSRGLVILPTGRLECESHMAVMALASFTDFRPPWSGQCWERFSVGWRRGCSLPGLSRAAELCGLDRGPNSENSLSACVSPAHASTDEGTNDGDSTMWALVTMPPDSRIRLAPDPKKCARCGRNRQYCRRAFHHLAGAR